MKVLIAIWLVVSIFAGLIILLVESPDTGPTPASVTRDSAVRYEIGEKVLADPYGSDEYSEGVVRAIKTEDEYVVKYCGPYGWSNHYKCETKALRRSQLAKIKGGEK